MQRVALARGLCVDSGVLLADEPTSELDEGNRSLVLRELRREAERGAVVVVATHDPAVVEACDRHFMLDEGRLVDHVTPVDPHRVSEALARPDRAVVEQARPPHFDLELPDEPDQETAGEADREPDEIFQPPRSLNGRRPESSGQPHYVGRRLDPEGSGTPGGTEPADPDAPF